MKAKQKREIRDTLLRQIEIELDAMLTIAAFPHGARVTIGVIRGLLREVQKYNRSKKQVRNYFKTF